MTKAIAIKRPAGVGILVVVLVSLIGLAVFRNDDMELNVAPSAASSMFSSHPIHPRDAVTALVRAFDDHSIVAIGESHDLQEAGKFYASLVRDKRFASIVDDIVVEFGNARYQSLIDRYVAGESVSFEELRHVWQDTTQVGSWDAPMYERFFRAVRAANQGLSGREQIRVLLGDPPIDWSRVDSTRQWKRFARVRESHMARLIERQVLAKNHTALLIAGLAHVTRGGGGVVDHLERSAPTSVFVVQIHLGFLNPRWEQEVEKWQSPSLAKLAETWMGLLTKGKGKAQDQLDALLYLAPPGALHLSVPPPSVYRNDDYWRTLKKRAKIVYRSFKEMLIFGAYSSPIYPEATVDFSGIEDSRRYAECMRKHDVDSFPEPRMEFDSFVFPGTAITDAQSDPQFEAAARACASILGLPPPPPRSGG